MSLKENFRDLFKPRKIRETERQAKNIHEAFNQEERATVAYLKDQITLKEYQQKLEEIRPSTKINLRKLASQ